MTDDDRAQSEVIGAILLVAVVVIAVTTFGVFYLNDESRGEPQPVADFEAIVTPTSVNISHLGGESIKRNELTVIIRNNSSTQRFSVANGSLTNSDTDGEFELGEEWGTTNISLSAGESVSIAVVHSPSNTLLYEGRTRVAT